MSNMNSRTRRRWYRLLAKRDGLVCKFCQKSPPEVKLVIDHKDNDNSNDHPSNLQLLCRRCNYLKNPRRPFDVSVSKSERIGVNSQRELDVNRNKEPQFREYAITKLDKEGRHDEDDLIFSAAEKLSLSPTTTRRYLSKMCSSEGKLERIRNGDQILIRFRGVK